MATIPVQTFAIPGQGVLHLWEGMGQGDDGEPVEISTFGDRTLQVAGGVTTGAPNYNNRLVLEGNNHPALFPWMGLSIAPGFVQLNPEDQAIAHQGAASPSGPNPRYFRPRLYDMPGDPAHVCLWCVEIDES
jgi:hypothetical protein